MEWYCNLPHRDRPYRQGQLLWLFCGSQRLVWIVDFVILISWDRISWNWDKWECSKDYLHIWNEEVISQEVMKGTSEEIVREENGRHGWLYDQLRFMQQNCSSRVNLTYLAHLTLFYGWLSCTAIMIWSIMNLWSKVLLSQKVLSVSWNWQSIYDQRHGLCAFVNCKRLLAWCFTNRHFLVQRWHQLWSKLVSDLTAFISILSHYGQD